MFLSYLSFFTFLSSIFIGITGYVLAPESKVNRALAFYVFILSFWSFADIFYNISTVDSVTWFWYKVEAVGWCGMISGILYFFLVYSNYWDRTPFPVKLIIFIYPAIIYVLVLFNVGYITGFEQGALGKIEHINIYSPASFMVFAGSISASIIGLVFVNLARIKSKSNRFRKQAKWLIVVSIISASIGPITNLLPLITNVEFPSLGSFFALFFIAGIVLLMFRYRLLRLDFQLFKDELMDSVSDIVVIISGECKVIRANKIMFDKLNITTDNPEGLDISDLFIENELVNENIGLAVSKRSKAVLRQTFMRRVDSDDLLISMTISPIFDKFDDYIGSILICRVLNEYETIFTLYKIAPQERKVVLSVIKGLSNREIADVLDLSEGTVKNYIYNIFKKTNSSNRAELIQLFSI